MQHFPLWQSLVNSITCYRATFPHLAIPRERHHMLPCNISPSLAIPRERASYVTVQHFPLWQSLVNEHHVTVQHFPLWQSLMNGIIMLPCNISPSLAIPREQHHVTVQHFPLWQSLVNGIIMLPCNISPLWQSLVNEHHVLPCNISPSGNPS